MPAQDFFTQLTTTKEVEFAKKRLEELQRRIYSSSESVDQYISEILKGDQRQTLINHLSEKKIDANDAVAVEKEIGQIINSLDQIPVVNLIIAIIPTKILLHNMLNQIEESSGKRPVFKVYVSEDIIGGAVFELNGQEYRYTVEESLKEVNIHE